MTENVIQPNGSRGRPNKHHNHEDKRPAYNRQIKERIVTFVIIRITWQVKVNTWNLINTKKLK